MALTIIKQPDSIKPAFVRNPIEVAVETDNYLINVLGQKKIQTVYFAQIVNMTAGSQFHVLCNGIDTIFDVVNTITGPNQIQSRSNFLASSAIGDNLFGQHMKSIFNAHPIIGAVFQGDYVYAGLTYINGTSIEFTSVNNGDFELEIGVTYGGFYMTNTVTQVGIRDEYMTRPTVLKLGLYLSVAGDPANDDTFTIQLDNVNYTFTFKSTPDSSGYQLPLRASMSLSDYQNYLLLKLIAAPCFLDKWIVTTEIYLTHIHFIFTSIGYIQGQIIATSNVARYKYANLPGYQEQYQENFTNNIQLLCEKNYLVNDFQKLVDLYSFPINEPDGDDAHYISRFKIDRILYDFMNKIYQEKLAEALPYVANFPHAKHLLKQFKFKYYETFGMPGVNQIVNDSATYIAALYGAGHVDFINRKTFNGFGFLHSSGIEFNPISLKQYVDIDQPCWLYFYLQISDSNDLAGVSRCFYIAHFDDGTTVTNDIASASVFDLPSNSSNTFFVKAGYNQLNLSALNTSTKKVYKWQVVIEIDDFSLTKTFVLDCCSNYKSFIMYQNSRGGYDTVAITAPKEFSLELTEGKEVERILSPDYVAHDSQFEATIPKVRQNIKSFIGWKKSSDFDVLKELLMSKYVFIIPKNTTDVFLPINIDRKNVQIESEDDFQRNYSIEFSPAHEFKNFENNLWLK